MKRYLMLPFFFMALAIMGACAVTPPSPGATSAAPQALEPTFTPTTAVAITTTVTTSATLTATATVAPATVLTAATTPTATTAITDAVALATTPAVTPTALITAPQATATLQLQGQSGTIANIVAARPEFATLNRAIAAVQLVNELNGDTPYTLFAPTESAFAALPAGTLNALLASPGTLASVLQNHLLIEEASSARLVRLGTVLTALGQTLPVTLTANGIVQLADATLIEPDIETTNGVIHGINRVLLPADLVITPTVNTPVGSAQVTATQAVTTVQIITSVAPTATLAAIVSATDELSMLETALGAAGLLQAIQLPGSLTLFAPTNAAFEALPDAQLQALLNTTGDVAAVMQYHLVADTALADDLVRLGAALSTSSQPLTITVAANSAVLVNNAQVVQADIVATNGVIHLIDAVLLPPAE